jgi:nitronate monooxygenase
MGTRFIASTECGATEKYKEMVVSSTHRDIVYTDRISGVHANFLAQTLPEDAVGHSPQELKRWRDIWSAGQGVSLVDEVDTIEGIVEGIVREYHDALSRLMG